MATDTRTNGAAPPQDAPNLRASLTEAFTQADDLAARSVQQLQRVHQARASQLARAAADVRAQPGANEADVKRAEAAVSAAKAVSSQFELTHRQLATPEPVVPPEGWVLHGRVLGAASDGVLKPIAGFTVYVVDSAKTYRQSYGFAYTDDTGYFLLKHQGDPEEPRVIELFVQVGDLKGRPVYVSATPFQPVAGTATYQNIILPEGAKPLGDPPAGVRRPRAPRRDTQS